MKTGMRIAYFARLNEARETLRTLRRKGCLRAAWVELDGRRVEGGVIPLGRDPVKHRVCVRIGQPASTAG